MPSLGRLADAVTEIVEGGSGMLEAAGDKVFAYDDAAVFAMIDSVAGLEHGADARELGVDADVGLARAFAARRQTKLPFARSN